MFMRLFIILIILISIVIGTLILIIPRDLAVNLIIFRDFFDVSLPILAFGALIKYLCTCTRKKCCCNDPSCVVTKK